MNLYARAVASKNKPTLLLEDNGFRLHFVSAKWTKDGKAIVLNVSSVMPNDAKVGSPSKRVFGDVFAYDYESHLLVMPAKGPAPFLLESDWDEAAHEVEKIVLKHGGLDSKEVTREQIRVIQTMPWPWEKIE